MLTQFGAPGVLSAGRISHNSIDLLIIIQILSHFPDLLDMSFSLYFISCWC